MNKTTLYRALSFLLSFVLIQSQVALANPKPLQGVLSPEKQTVYIDPSPSSQGKKVYSIIPGQEGKEAQIRRGVIENGKIIWSDGATESLRPTRVIKHTTWDTQKQQSMKSLIERLKKGDHSLLNEMNEQSARNLERNRQTISKTAGMTQMGIAFYLALGVLAYFHLSTNYANNPNAWSDFADSLNDPIGWLMLPAFIVASHKFFKRAAAMKGLKAFGMTSAGMAVGLIATTVLGKMLYDPNFKQCMGFTSYDEHGHFQRNELACDQLYEAWAGEELFLTVVPLIGHAVMAGGIVAAVIWFAKLGLNATQLAEKIKVGASFLKKPKAGGLISIVSGIGGMILFFGAFQLSYAIVDIESNLRDFFLTTFNPFHDPQGSSISSNLDKLNRAFQAEIKDGFKEKVQIDNKGEGCVRAASRYHKKDQAEKICGGTHFDEVLVQHLELMTKWRTHKFSRVNQAYQAWNTRSDGFADIAATAYVTYRDFLIDLTRHRQGEIDMKSSDYQENLRLNTNQSESLATAALEYDGIFENVMVRDHYDYFLTSMACGPDTKPADSKTGFFAGIKSMITSEPTPTEMVINEHGQKAMFYPPRLIISPQEFNICSMHPMKAARSGFKILDTLRDYTPEPPFMSATIPLPPDKIYGVVGDQKFLGALDYLIKVVPEELAPHQGESQFESWWASEVVPALEEVNTQIGEEYSEFLNTTYREVLTSNDARCSVEEELVSFNGIGTLLKEAKVPSSCPSSSNFRLGEGLSNSVHEQVALYYSLILQILEKGNMNHNEVKPLMTSHLLKLHLLFEALSLKDSNPFERLSELAQALSETDQELFGALAQISSDHSAGTERSRQLIAALSVAAKSAMSEGLYFQVPLTGDGVLARLQN